MTGVSADLRTIVRSAVPTGSWGRGGSVSVTVPLWVLALPWVVAVVLSRPTLRDIRRAQRLCVCGYESSGLGFYDCHECGRVLDAAALGDDPA